MSRSGKIQVGHATTDARRGRSIAVATALAGLALAVSMSACGGSSKSEGATASTAKASGVAAPATLNSKGTFAVCMDVSLPPMEFYETPGAAPDGFDVDLVKEVASTWGVAPAFKAMAFPGLIPALAAGRCDAIWSALRISPDRLGKDLAAVPYYKSRFVLMVKSGNPDQIHGPDDLSGKTVAVETVPILRAMLEATSSKLKKQGKPGIRIQDYPTAADATQQLIVNRANAVLTLEVEGIYRITKQKNEFEIVYTYPDVSEFGVYYKKSNQALGDALKSGIANLVQQGKSKQIAGRWDLPANLLVTP